MKVVNEVLSYDSRSPKAAAVEAKLRKLVVGQDEAIDKIVDVYETYLAGLNPIGRPIGNLIFLGPTGVGKTRVVEAFAEAVFNDPRAVLRVDCAEFQHGHEIARLVGSPPGYLGHRETQPMLTQETLNQFQTTDHQFSILLFDEVEKANDALWKLMLGVLDKASLTLGDNRRVDFSKTIIFFTSNVGAGAMAELTEGGRGFLPGRGDSAKTKAEITKTATEAMKRQFSPEFVNRVDNFVVFNTLHPKQLETILEIELGHLQQRVLRASGSKQFVFFCDAKVKKMLLQEGFDQKYGARHLKRAIERHLVQPISSMVSSGQIRLGDYIKIGLDKNGKPTFTKEAEGALVPLLLEKAGYHCA